MNDQFENEYYDTQIFFRPWGGWNWGRPGWGGWGRPGFGFGFGFPFFWPWFWW